LDSLNVYKFGLCSLWIYVAHQTILLFSTLQENGREPGDGDNGEKKVEGGRGLEWERKRGAGREDRMGEEKGTGEGGKKH
jgi:hypothetical protein